MDILGIYLANIHISVRSVLGVWMGDGKSMMRWVVCQVFGWWSIIIIIVIGVVVIIIESITLGEKRGVSRMSDNVTRGSGSIIGRKDAESG